MPSRPSRRQFLQTSAIAAAGYWAAGGVKAEKTKSPNQKLQFACIGVGGKGASDTADAGNHGEVVAICDVDDRVLNKAAGRFTKAEKFYDYRKLLEKLGDKIDAVTVSTPDHHHAIAAAMAMRMGKHCFCQKPLTRTIWEARMLGEIAREKKVATQMGNQGAAVSGFREAAARIRAGMLGNVHDVHVWTNRPVWPQGGSRPKEAKAPPNVHWDEFIGPAPKRPFGHGYQPFVWRGWWDFGSGALGDMACHTVNMPFAALDLRNPIAVEAETSGHNKDSFPKWSKIKYFFAATSTRPAVTLHWYDGGKRPDPSIVADPPHLKGDNGKPFGSGCVILGDKGYLVTPDDYGSENKIYGGAVAPKVEFERSPGHFQEWVQAIRGGKPAWSNFPDYAGPFTEMVLVGNLAVWQGGRIEWDAKNMKASVAGLEALIKPEYHNGYTL